MEVGILGLNLGPWKKVDELVLSLTAEREQLRLQKDEKPQPSPKT